MGYLIWKRLTQNIQNTSFWQRNVPFLEGKKLIRTQSRIIEEVQNAELVSPRCMYPIHSPPIPVHYIPISINFVLKTSHIIKLCILFV